MGLYAHYCPVCGTGQVNRGVCWSCQSRERYETQRQLDEQRRTADRIAYAAEAQMAHERAVALITAAHQEQLARELERDRKLEAERNFVRHALHEIASQEVDNPARATARISIFLGTQEYRRNPKFTERVVRELGLVEAYFQALLPHLAGASSEEVEELLNRTIQRTPEIYARVVTSREFRSRSDYERFARHQEDYYAGLAEAEAMEREQEALAEEERRLTKTANRTVLLITCIIVAVGAGAMFLVKPPEEPWHEKAIARMIMGALYAVVPAVTAWKIGRKLALCWVAHRLGKSWRFPGLLDGAGGKATTSLVLMILGAMVYFIYTAPEKTGIDIGSVRLLGQSPVLFWGGLVALEGALCSAIIWLLWPRDM